MRSAKKYPVVRSLNIISLYGRYLEEQNTFDDALYAKLDYKLYRYADFNITSLRNVKISKS